MLGIFDVKISITCKDIEPISFDASFDIRNLKPVLDTVNNKGCTFTVNSLTETAKTFFVKVGSENYAPYKHFIQGFDPSNTPQMAKSISSSFQTNDGKVSVFTVTFAYDANWEVLSDRDQGTITQWLNSQKNLRETYVRELKINAQNYIESYFTNRYTGAKWTSDVNSKTAEINRLIAANVELEKKLKSYGILKLVKKFM